jgi:hypothetical protein
MYIERPLTVQKKKKKKKKIKVGGDDWRDLLLLFSSCTSEWEKLASYLR